ncbi:MAG TPA: CehA/McbA family metallohydrolase [Polyangiaceae bacterium]|nr:CehA/McbA family metallohydrolase [Polyangiaceae bacterium]
MRFSPPLPAAAALVALALSCGGSPEPDGGFPTPARKAPLITAMAKASPAPASSGGPNVPAPSGATGSAKRIAVAAEVPLKSWRVDARPGDFLLTSGGAAAVVSSEGRLIDFGPEGGRDEMASFAPTIALGIGDADTDAARIEIVDGRLVRVTRPVFGRAVSLVSFIYFTGKILKVDSMAVGTGDDPALAAVLGERASWGNVPTWVEGHGYIHTAGTRPGHFIARENYGVAYAMCSSSGRVIARFGASDLPGFFEPARTGEGMVLVPLRGASPARSVSITYATSLGDAVLALPCAGPGPWAPWSMPLVRIEGARLEIARCAEGGGVGQPYLEINAEGGEKDGKSRDIKLPQGCFRVRYRAPGHAPGQWISRDALSAPLSAEALPTAGRLRWDITERGKPVPARLLVRGIAGTPDPHWGTEAKDGASLNVVHSDTGSGRRPIPPGKYRVSVTRGFEYTAQEIEIDVTAGQEATMKAAIERVVDTRGWIAADLHLHAIPSPDAPSMLADRVRSLVAAGVEVGVATDHNAVTDYSPVIRDLKLGQRVASVVGDEVTTRDLSWGHFNVFPLAAGAEPLPYLRAMPAGIFAAARASKPLGEKTVLQVNHPRMGDIGYFDILRMDSTDIEGWLRRTPAAQMGFDAIEIFNGDHYDRIHKVEECMRDWYALLNAGFRYTATGNSDSHRISFHEPGAPRTLVAVPSDNPGALDERAFADAIRGGRAIVSSGPFVTLSAGGQGIGSTIAPGTVDLEVRVDAPPWVDVDRVQLVRRGAILREWGAADIAAAARPITLKAQADLKAGDWVIAIARGTKPMTFLHRQNAQPFAFTNAIYVK